jgi:predicted extracellular nuclease
MALKKLLSRFIAVFSCLFAIAASLAAQDKLVISQVYGGGGSTSSSAAYNQDYVELFNAGASPVSLSGYSVQYGSSSSNSFSGITVLGSLTLQPGQYYLVSEGTPSSGGGSLPVGSNTTSGQTGDLQGTINMSATGGKVALVLGTLLLNAANSCSNTAVQDLVGYGSLTYAICAEGTAVAALDATKSAYRNDACIDTNNNAADFSTGTPTNTGNPQPHTSLSGFKLCSGSSTTNPSGSGSASPNSATSGVTSVTLLVNVNSGTNPTSTGIAVTGNLSSIGGSATQAFSAAGGSSYSFTITPTVATSGNVSLPITISDAQGRSGTTSIGLSVQLPAPHLAIHAVQGSKPLNATAVSPYAGQSVEISGIVTGVGSAGFFIQAPDSDADSDPSTPEGVYIFTGSNKVPVAAVIGNLVTVTGTVTTYPVATDSHTPATEITSPVTVLVSQAQPLPTAITLTASMLTPSGGIYQMARYEGMRIAIPTLNAITGTDGSITEASATVSSNGQFYAVLPDYPRPFREPGIDIRDAAVPNTPANVAHFDDNPERLLMDSKFLGGNAINLGTGTVVSNVTGIVDMTYSSDSYYDPARILIDKGYTPSLTTPSKTYTVSAQGSSEFTVATYNVERMFDTDSSDNKYYDPVSQSVKTSSAVNLSSTAFDKRITKIAMGILQNLKAPDIVGLEEIENQDVAKAIAAKISTLAPTLNIADPGYAGYGVSASAGTYTSDIGGISTGFLVKASKVHVTSTQQMGQNETFQSPVDNSTTTLNDRPAFVLKAGIVRGTGVKDYPVTVIVNHLRSLSGIEDASNYTRYKKELQAESLAKIIQAAQVNGEHVISVGDYNAFEFSDGYTDTLGTVTGRILPSDQVVQPGTTITNPLATDLITLRPASERWTYSEFGSAQVLDHIVATQDLVGGARVEVAHINADQPLVNYADGTTAFRASDHDPVDGYFALPSAVLSGTITPASVSFGAVNLGSTSAGQNLVLSNTGEATLMVTSGTVTGDFAYSTTCNTIGAAINSTCGVNVTFTPAGIGARTGTLTLKTNGGQTFTIQLSGAGTDFSSTGSSGTSVSLTVSAGDTATLPLTFTAMGGFSGTVSISCALTKPAPGVVCNTPANFPLTGTTTQNVTFTTTTRNVASGVAIGSRSGIGIALSITFGAIVMLFAGRTRRFARQAGLLLVLLGVTFAAIGCGDNKPSTNPLGTPAGAYTYTVTSTSGSLSHSVVVTLNVQ